MRISLSSFAFYKFPLETAIEKTANLRFDSIELSANRPHFYPDDYPRGSERNKIITLVNSRNLSISALTSSSGFPHWHLTHPNRRVRDATVRYIQNCIDLACDLGCKVVEVTSGRPVIEGIKDEDSWNWLTDSLAKCADYAHSKGKIVGLEPEPNNFISTTDHANRVLEAIDSGGLGYLLDTGHVNLAHENIADSIRKGSIKPVHVHIHDNDSEKDQHLLPGRGKINFESILSSLKVTGYDGFLSIEVMQVESEQQLADANRNLQSLIQSV